MANSSLVAILIMMSVITFLLRAAPLTFLSRFQFPPVVRSSLEYVPVSILSVLLVSEIFVKQGRLHFNISDSALWAAVFTFGVAFYSRNFILTVALGILSSALLRLALGA